MKIDLRALFVVGTVAAAGACQQSPAPAVELDLGDPTLGVRHLVPRSAWAEHLVIPGARNELRIVLATGAATCDRYVPPADDEVLLTLTVTGPLDRPLGPGVYTWSDPPRSTDPKAPVAALAVPKILIGQRSFQPPPGGGLELQVVEPPPHGKVSGVLGFAFPGAAGVPATSIKGNFVARSCTADGSDRR